MRHLYPHRADAAALAGTVGKAALLPPSPPFAGTPGVVGELLLQAGVVFPRIIMIKSCKSSMPHSARWRRFLGKGRDGARDTEKKIIF